MSLDTEFDLDNFEDSIDRFTREIDKLKAANKELEVENNKLDREFPKLIIEMARLKDKLDVAREALKKDRFDFEMITKHGGVNHNAIPRIDEALEKIGEK